VKNRNSVRNVSALSNWRSRISLFSGGGETRLACCCHTLIHALVNCATKGGVRSTENGVTFAAQHRKPSLSQGLEAQSCGRNTITITRRPSTEDPYTTKPFFWTSFRYSVLYVYILSTEYCCRCYHTAYRTEYRGRTQSSLSWARNTDHPITISRPAKLVMRPAA
jgi:hypothetical protein